MMDTHLSVGYNNLALMFSFVTFLFDNKAFRAALTVKDHFWDLEIVYYTQPMTMGQVASG